MAKIKLELQTLTDQQLDDVAVDIIAKLTDNPHVPAPVPTVADLQTKLNAYQGARHAQIAAQIAVPATTAAKNGARSALADALTAEAATVQIATDGDEAKILTTGMGVQGGPTHVTAIDTPENFALSTGDGAGELDWQCDPVARAKSYQVQVSVGPAPGAWQLVPGSTKSKGTIAGLTSGANVWVRLQAMGPNSLTSSWTAPQGKIVP